MSEEDFRGRFLKTRMYESRGRVECELDCQLDAARTKQTNRSKIFNVCSLACLCHNLRGAAVIPHENAQTKLDIYTSVFPRKTHHVL